MIRRVESSKRGTLQRKMPIANRTAARRAAIRKSAPREAPAASRLSNDKLSTSPTIQRNEGNTRSAVVHPCHSEWRSGAYTWSQSPGLLTSSIKATAAPLNASMEARRAGADADAVTEETPVALNPPPHGDSP